MERKSKERVIPLEIYTDGSCKKLARRTFGGWAFIAIEDSQEVYRMTGGELDTTNQRMELQAIRQAFLYAQQARKLNQPVIIYSDSAYAVNCYCQQWYQTWRKNGWLTASKKEVANQDLWTDIIPFFENIWYYLKKVDGHNGVFWNEKCDALAQDFAAQLKINWRG